MAETRITVCRRIVDKHLAEEIDGVLIDAQTANLLVKIWELLGPKSRETFETTDIGRLGRWAWSQVAV